MLPRGVTTNVTEPSAAVVGSIWGGVLQMVSAARSASRTTPLSVGRKRWLPRKASRYDAPAGGLTTKRTWPVQLVRRTCATVHQDASARRIISSTCSWGSGAPWPRRLPTTVVRPEARCGLRSRIDSELGRRWVSTTWRLVRTCTTPLVVGVIEASPAKTHRNRVAVLIGTCAETPPESRVTVVATAVQAPAPWGSDSSVTVLPETSVFGAARVPPIVAGRPGRTAERMARMLKDPTAGAVVVVVVVGVGVVAEATGATRTRPAAAVVAAIAARIRERVMSCTARRRRAALHG